MNFFALSATEPFKFPNGGLMYALGVMVVAFVLAQSLFFIIKSWKKGTELGITKETLKKLIQEGRYSFVNGGFVMEDEAVSHYTDASHQLRIGLEFLKTEFNYTPTVGWFIDQFGHSDSHAYIYQQFGFTSLVLNRLSTIQKKQLYKQKELFLLNGKIL